MDEIVLMFQGETPEVDLTPEEEEQVRQSILQGMFLIRGTLQSQLSHAVQLMAKVRCSVSPRSLPNALLQRKMHSPTVSYRLVFPQNNFGVCASFVGVVI